MPPSPPPTTRLPECSPSTASGGPSLAPLERAAVHAAADTPLAELGGG